MVWGPQHVLLSLVLTVLATPHASTSSRSDNGTSVVTGVPGSPLPRLNQIEHNDTGGVCDSRTVNHITYGLPQQCLKTDGIQVSSSHVSTLHEHLTTHTAHSSSHRTEPSLSTSTYISSRSTNSQTPKESTVPAHTTSEDISLHWTQTSLLSPSEASPTTTVTPAEPSDVSKGIESNVEDSPLDTAHFLSFEEWKKQNLAKAGQSPENVGQRTEPFPNGRPRPAINNALDTLGDESEIDIDFGFGETHTLRKDSPSSDTSSAQKHSADAPAASSPSTRSKDAGKTCKERTNYASFDCAATVMKNNPECRSASSVLVEHKDSYMLNKCSAKNKFIVVELCDDILVDTVVLANYEFFSSIFRHFRVSVSDRYPPKGDKWKDLGTFEARSTREIQAFLIENPLIWARYLKIEFLTHYGNEYYCPVSLLRVHGTTMMEEFKHQEELTREDAVDENTAEKEAERSSIAEIIPSSDTNQQIADNTKINTANIAADMERTEITQQPGISQSAVVSAPSPKGSVETELELVANMSQTPMPSSHSTDNSTIGISATPVVNRSSGPNNESSIDSTAKLSSNTSSSPDIISPQTSTGNKTAHLQNSTSVAESMTASVRNTEAGRKNSQPEPSNTSSTPNASSHVGSSTNRSSESSKPSTQAHSTSSTAHIASVDSTRSSASSSIPNPHPQPSTQESFFKSVHKRLQQLESNSTLSLQYIEEQSRLLRDAFNKVEKRQAANALSFLTHLNETVMTELGSHRQAYDKLWQTTVSELESHREQYQREMLALSSRLTLVADELLWQKRVGILQSTLLLVVLGLVLFTRQGTGGVEIPIIQQVMNRSQAAFRTGWESDPGSSSPSSNRSKLLIVDKLDSPSSDNDFPTDDAESRPQMSRGFAMHISPPTPESNTTASISDDDDSDLTLEIGVS